MVLASIQSKPFRFVCVLFIASVICHSLFTIHTDSSPDLLSFDLTILPYEFDSFIIFNDSFYFICKYHSYAELYRIPLPFLLECDRYFFRDLSSLSPILTYNYNRYVPYITSVSTSLYIKGDLLFFCINDDSMIYYDTYLYVYDRYDHQYLLDIDSYDYNSMISLGDIILYTNDNNIYITSIASTSMDLPGSLQSRLLTDRFYSIMDMAITPNYVYIVGQINDLDFYHIYKLSLQNGDYFSYDNSPARSLASKYVDDSICIYRSTPIIKDIDMFNSFKFYGVSGANYFVPLYILHENGDTDKLLDYCTNCWYLDDTLYYTNLISTSMVSYQNEYPDLYTDTYKVFRLSSDGKTKENIIDGYYLPQLIDCITCIDDLLYIPVCNMKDGVNNTNSPDALFIYDADSGRYGVIEVSLYNIIGMLHITSNNDVMIFRDREGLHIVNIDDVITFHKSNCQVDDFSAQHQQGHN